MDINKYIATNFPGLQLVPSLYNQWEKSIHLEFAKGLYQFKDDGDELNPIYFQQVYQEAIELFHDVFAKDDELFLVTNVFKDEGIDQNIKVYKLFIKNKQTRYRLKQETFPYSYDDEDVVIAQFSLQCKKQDISYPLLLKAICNQDFPPLKPRLSQNQPVFFINATRNIIFYLYDDRGCEIISDDLEKLRPLYEKHKELLYRYSVDEQMQRFKVNGEAFRI